MPGCHGTLARARVAATVSKHDICWVPRISNVTNVTNHYGCRQFCLPKGCYKFKKFENIDVEDVNEDKKFVGLTP